MANIRWEELVTIEDWAKALGEILNEAPPGGRSFPVLDLLRFYYLPDCNCFNSSQHQRRAEKRRQPAESIEEYAAAEQR